jgi:hypothetical protein
MVSGRDLRTCVALHALTIATTSSVVVGYVTASGKDGGYVVPGAVAKPCRTSAAVETSIPAAAILLRAVLRSRIGAALLEAGETEEEEEEEAGGVWE